MGFLRDPSWDPYFLPSTHHQLELLLSVLILRYTSTRITHKYIYFKTKDFKSQAEALRAIQECVSEIRQWIAENKLQLNDQKTEFVIICAPWKRDCVQFDEIEIGDARISSTTDARNLGVIMDISLNIMKTHSKTLPNINRSA